MEKKIDELEEEITILEKRIGVLERTERKRKIFKLLKLMLFLFIILFVAFGLWKTYDYVVNEVPNMINKEVENKKNDLGNKIKEILPNK